MKTKVCRKCGVEKSVNEFHISKQSSNGLQGYCIECNITSVRQWTVENKKLTDNQTLIYACYSNVLDEVCYVGQTDYTLSHRILRHHSYASHGGKTPLAQHLLKYGTQDLTFFPVIIQDKDKMKITEHDVALLFNTYNRYNVIPCNGHKGIAEDEERSIEYDTTA